jgi:DNA-binding GntR family transcriptional regulator
VPSSRRSSTTEPPAFARTIAKERICALVIGGTVPFDKPLSERAIAEAVDMGRMPVREALRELAMEGIVAVEPGRGTFLVRLRAADITELLEVRLAIEGMGARLAAEKGYVGELPQVVAALRELGRRPLAGKRVAQAEEVGDRVHREIVQGAGNAILDQLYAGIRLRVRISLRLVQRRDVDRIHETIAEHIAIAEAILAGSGDAAVRALERHLLRGHEVTTANLDAKPAKRRGASAQVKESAVARPRGRRPAMPHR